MKDLKKITLEIVEGDTCKDCFSNISVPMMNVQNY